MSRNLSVSKEFIAECENPGWFDESGNATKTLAISCMFTSEWIALTDYVLGLSINGSIGNMSGSPAPDRCDIMLQNRDRRFSDLYSSSEYYGSLKPNKRVKVELTATGDLMLRGDCESATPPYIRGETDAALAVCTFARSAALAHIGTYSYKMTKTGAGWALASMHNTADVADMVGLVPGETYVCKAWMYVPSVGGPTAPGECYFEAGYSTGVGWTYVSSGVTAFDAWEEKTLTFAIPTGATGARVHFVIHNDSTIGEFCYVDDISFIGPETVPIFTGRVDESGWQEERHGGDGTVRISCLDEAGRLETKLFEKDVVIVGKVLAATSAVDSVLKTVLVTNGGLQASSVVVNGLMDITIPYAQFRAGQSIWSAVQSIAKSGLASYCGFGADGKFYFDSMLATGWESPSSEYTLTSADLGMDLSKVTESLMGNHVKVRGSDLTTSSAETVVWSLTNVKDVGKNALYPTATWEVVAAGDYYLCDPVATSPVDYFARYEVKGSEVIYTSGLSIVQKTFNTVSSEVLTTSSSELAWSPTQGLLVLKNEQATPVILMGMDIKGPAVTRKTMANRYTDSTGKFEEERFNPLRQFGFVDDDLRWGRVCVIENATSEAEYGEKWMTISDDLIVRDEQMSRIADYWLTYGKDPKRRFTISGLPFLAFLQSASIATLTISELGFGADCELTGYAHTISQGKSDTTLTLLEKTTWVASSAVNARVRRIAAGAGDAGSAAPGGALVLTVAASDNDTPTDYKCSGTADQQFLKTLADRLANDFGGGTIQLTEGNYYFSSSMAMPSGVWLQGRGSATVLKRNCNDSAISAVGTSGARLSNVVISNLTVTRDAADTYDQRLVQLQYCDNFLVSGIVVDSPHDIGMHVQYSNGTIDGCTFADYEYIGLMLVNSDTVVRGCMFTGGLKTNAVNTNGIYVTTGRSLISGCSFIDIVNGYAMAAINLYDADGSIISNNTFYGIEESYSYTFADPFRSSVINFAGESSNCLITGNRIENCRSFLTPLYSAILVVGATNVSNIITGNHCVDNGNLINRANCELATPPYLTGQSGVSYTTGVPTFARSNNFADAGTYSYKFTKTNAAGTYEAVYLHDAIAAGDLVGLTAGGMYVFEARVYIPAASGIVGTEVLLASGYYEGGVWVDSSAPCANTYDAWQTVTLTITMGTAAATGCYVRIQAASTAALNEYFYVDNLGFGRSGIGNAHEQSYRDDGTDTKTNGNSWEL